MAESAAGGIEAGKAYVKAFLDDNPITEGLERVKGKLEKWSEQLEKVGSRAHGGELPGPLKAIMAFAESPSGIFAGLSEAAHHTAEENEHLGNLAKSAGMTVERFSDLAYAANHCNVSAEALAQGMKNLDRDLYRAGNGATRATGHLKAAMDALKIDPRQIHNSSEAFRAIADNLQRFDRQSQQELAIKGKFTELLPLLRKGNEEIDKLTARSASLGLTTTKEDVEDAERFGHAFKDLKFILDNAVQQIGGALLPVITSLTRNIAAGVVVVRDWIKHHQGLVQLLFYATGAVVGFGVAMYAGSYILKVAAGAIGMVQGAIWLLSTAFSVMSAAATIAWACVTSPVSWILAGIGGVVVAIGYLVGAFDGMGGLLKNFMGDVNETFEGISAALAKGDISAAWGIVCSFMEVEWERLKKGLWDIWLGFKLEFWLSVLSLAEVFATLWGEMRQGFNSSLAWMQKAWNQWKTNQASATIAEWIAPLFEDREGKAKTARMEAAARAQGVEVKNDISKESLTDKVRQEVASAKKQAVTDNSAIDAEAAKKNAEVSKETRAAMVELDRQKGEAARAKEKSDAEMQKKIDAKKAELSALVNKAKEPGENEADKKEGTDHFQEASHQALGTFSGVVAGMLAGPADQVQNEIAQNTADALVHLKAIHEAVDVPRNMAETVIGGMA